MDLGFSGPNFTWNSRQKSGDNVRVRLDRTVANGHFLQLFNDCNVDNIITSSSDHYATRALPVRRS
jgi:exonuclease III